MQQAAGGLLAVHLGGVCVYAAMYLPTYVVLSMCSHCCLSPCYGQDAACGTTGRARLGRSPRPESGSGEGGMSRGAGPGPLQPADRAEPGGEEGPPAWPAFRPPLRPPVLTLRVPGPCGPQVGSWPW